MLPPEEMPEALSCGSIEYHYSVTPVHIPVNGHTLYGELLLPVDEKRKTFPTVICCHGFGSTYDYAEDTVGIALAKSGIAAFCFDFYGGNEDSRSGGTMKDMSIFTEEEDLKAVVRTVKTFETTDVRNLFLLGQSQGGLVSAMTASDIPDDIKALLLFFPAFAIPDDAGKMFRTAEDIPETVHMEIFGIDLSRIYYEKLLSYDVYSDIEGYEGPVLIIHGDSDRIVSISYSEKALSVYSNARLITLPGQGHGFDVNGKRKGVELAYSFIRDNIS